MLDDTPRKLLRIMVHFSGHFRRMPTLPELQRLSGRKQSTIKVAMSQLIEQHYIQWDQNRPIETAVVLESWERDVRFKEPAETDLRKPQQEPAAGNTDYWIYH